MHTGTLAGGSTGGRLKAPGRCSGSFAHRMMPLFRIRGLPDIGFSDVSVPPSPREDLAHLTSTPVGPGHSLHGAIVRAAGEMETAEHISLMKHYGTHPLAAAISSRARASGWLFLILILLALALPPSASSAASDK